MEREHISQAMASVGDVLWRAIDKHPQFTTHGLSHAISILTEEVGEAAKEINDYLGGDLGGLHKAYLEIAQVGAVALRCLALIEIESRARGLPLRVGDVLEVK